MNQPKKPLASKLAATLCALALGSVAPTVAGLALAVPSEARAADRVDCDVHAIHLIKEGDGKIPAELKFLEAQLADDQFAAYKGFRLLERKKLLLQAGAPGKASFKSGHRLGLKLLDAGDKRLRLHASLTGRDGDKPLVSTAYGIDDGGVFMMGGSSYQGGKLLFAIRCASRG